jgi:heptosyltransferase-1
MQFLIVKTSSLGDIIHAFGVADFLKRKFPESSIDWVVEKPFASLLDTHPLIRNVICIQTKKWRKNPLAGQTRAEYRHFKKQLQAHTYDAVFDLQGNIKSGWVTYLADAPVKIGFGSKTVPEKPNLLATNHRFDPPAGHNIRDDYLFLPRSYFNDFATIASDQVILKGDIPVCQLPANSYKVMVCPGSAWPNKQLTPETLQKYLQRYQQQKNCHFLMIWGNEQERELARLVQLNVPNTIIADKMTLPQLQKMMAQMDLVISVDSLPLHLAGTTSTATYSIFGPSSALKYAPVGSQHKHLQGGCPYHKTFEKRCPLLRKCSTGACMHDLSSDTLESVNRL